MPGDFLTDDLTTFFNTDEFAVSAVYTPAGGSAEDAVNGILDEELLQGNQYSGQVQEASAEFTGLYSDMAGWKLNGRLTINGVNYQVQSDPVPDGTGWASVPLEREEPTKI